ncbi:rab9 effector protein [Anaeramoeba flamelloides]|uniref:Rab9 effector protein n=1 Tax=Anaeramoeba flamelloides TaxID=1746091 RepID=A0ABQ8XA31_9EUKA|nr:rab9 effector protein [Anaeramoeba flamelloides]
MSNRSPKRRPPLPKRNKRKQRTEVPVHIETNVLTLQKVFRGYRSRKYLHKKHKKQTKKLDFLKEIVSTERTFVKNLKDLLCEFFYPIRKSQILEKSEIIKIFNNIESLFFLNRALLHNLETRKTDLSVLVWSDIFLKFLPNLVFYSAFINNFDIALKRITINSEKNKKFKQFLDTSNSSQNLKGLKLSDLFITPVQRIPRYVLLIKGVLENTDPMHYDYLGFTYVLEKMKEIADLVNSNKSEMDNFHKFVELQKQFINCDENFLKSEGRQLIFQGHLAYTLSENAENSWCFLFNDILLIANKLADNKFESKKIVPTEKLIWKDDRFTRRGELDLIIGTSKETFIFKCDNPRHKMKWKGVFNKVFEVNAEKKKSQSQLVNWKKVKTKGNRPPPIEWASGCVYDNDLYLFGGETKMKSKIIINNNLYIFNLQTNTWKMTKPRSGKTPTPRYSHTMSLIGNKIYVFGGTNGKTKLGDLHIYNIETNSWENNPFQIGSIPCARSGHAAAVIENQIWIFGGRSEGGSFLNDLYCFDSNTKKWFNVIPDGAVPKGRAWHSANFVYDQFVIFGGSSFGATFCDIWVYDLYKNQWYEAEIAGNTPQKRFGHGSVFINNQLWFIGGTTAFNEVNEVLILDFNSASWDYTYEIGDIPNSKSRQVACLINEELEQIIIVGGGNGSKLTNKTFLLETNYKKTRTVQPTFDPNKQPNFMDERYIDYQTSIFEEYFKNELEENSINETQQSNIESNTNLNSTEKKNKNKNKNKNKKINKNKKQNSKNFKRRLSFGKNKSTLVSKKIDLQINVDENIGDGQYHSDGNHNENEKIYEKGSKTPPVKRFSPHKRSKTYDSNLSKKLTSKIRKEDNLRRNSTIITNKN